MSAISRSYGSECRVANIANLSKAARLIPEGNNLGEIYYLAIMITP